MCKLHKLLQEADKYRAAEAAKPGKLQSATAAKQSFTAKLSAFAFSLALSLTIHGSPYVHSFAKERRHGKQCPKTFTTLVAVFFSIFGS